MSARSEQPGSNDNTGLPWMCQRAIPSDDGHRDPNRESIVHWASLEKPVESGFTGAEFAQSREESCDCSSEGDVAGWKDGDGTYHDPQSARTQRPKSASATNERVCEQTERFHCRSPVSAIRTFVRQRP